MSRFRLRTAFVAMFVLGIGLAIAGRYWRAWQQDELGERQLRALGRAYKVRGVYETGSSGLSWRVHLLPALGEKVLHDKFRLDEPWDSPHNAPLVAEMPAIYRVPGSRAPLGWSATFLIDVNRFEGRTDFDGEDVPYLVQLTDDRAVPWTQTDALWTRQKTLEKSGVRPGFPQRAQLIRGVVCGPSITD